MARRQILKQAIEATKYAEENVVWLEEKVSWLEGNIKRTEEFQKVLKRLKPLILSNELPSSNLSFVGGVVRQPPTRCKFAPSPPYRREYEGTDSDPWNRLGRWKQKNVPKLPRLGNAENCGGIHRQSAPRTASSPQDREGIGRIAARTANWRTPSHRFHPASGAGNNHPMKGSRPRREKWKI